MNNRVVAGWLIEKGLSGLGYFDVIMKLLETNPSRGKFVDTVKALTDVEDEEAEWLYNHCI